MVEDLGRRVRINRSGSSLEVRREPYRVSFPGSPFLRATGRRPGPPGAIDCRARCGGTYECPELHSLSASS